nr:hypothetical protein [Paraburkholderia ultramafica]
MRDFATAVKTLAGNKDLTRDALVKQLCELADAALEQDVPSRTSLMRTQLVSKRRVARALLAKLLDLPFQAQAAHPVMDALVLLGKLYANKAVGLPPDTGIPLGRAWQRMIAGENRGDALIAFEWATLFALRVALRNGSVYVEHSFSFRSLGMLLIHSNNS